MSLNLYTCDYCHTEYVPTRRGVQRFCKASCRTRAHQVKNQSKLGSPVKEKKKKKKLTVGKIEKMSVAGIGNATVGNLASDFVQNIFTREENKPATKGDLAKVISHLERFQFIKNLSLNEYNQQPYFDLETKNIIYK
jgi:hypothetical protein